jgi:hypothetical protein
MAFDARKPEDQGYLADFPPEMREQLRALIHDELVNAGLLKGLVPGNNVGNIAVNNGVLNTNLNAALLEGRSAGMFAAEGHTHATATQSSNGLMSNADKAKLDTINTGAEVNQNAFTNVSVGGVVIQADNKNDTLTLAAGNNITLTPDAANDRITISLSGTVESANVAGRLSGARSIALGGKISATGIGFDGTRDITLNVTNVTADYCMGNAATASRLSASRLIRLTGNTTGENYFDGSGNVIINTTTEVAQRVEDMSSRNGFKTLVQACMAGNDFFRIGVGGDNDAGYAEVATGDNANEAIYVRQYTGEFQNLIRTLTLLDGSGNTGFPGEVWARAFHGHADSSSNANALGGQSLQWVFEQINAAKTGIVASNLAQNGWVKFANGLIVQWGFTQEKRDGDVENYKIVYPIAYTRFCVPVSTCVIKNYDGIARVPEFSWGEVTLQYARYYRRWARFFVVIGV